MNRRWLAVIFAASTFLATTTPTQSQQPVLLQIRPRAGDTLAVRLDQRMEMTGIPTECASSTGAQLPFRDSARMRSCSSAARQMTTVTEVFSRAIVQKSTKEGATVLAVTDSIRAAASRGPRMTKPERVPGNDNTIRLNLSTDGGAEVADSEASDQVRKLFGQMPAVLSRNPVSVGDKWKREMRIPDVGVSGAMGRVRATFQLDSVGDNGNMAYISMRGTLSHDHSDGSNSELEGSMTGSMALDRRLGWIVHTSATIDVTSIVRRPAPALPMRVRTKVTQLLRAGLAR